MSLNLYRIFTFNQAQCQYLLILTLTVVASATREILATLHFFLKTGCFFFLCADGDPGPGPGTYDLGYKVQSHVRSGTASTIPSGRNFRLGNE